MGSSQVVGRLFWSGDGAIQRFRLVGPGDRFVGEVAFMAVLSGPDEGVTRVMVLGDWRWDSQCHRGFLCDRHHETKAAPLVPPPRPWTLKTSSNHHHCPNDTLYHSFLPSRASMPPTRPYGHRRNPLPSYVPFRISSWRRILQGKNHSSWDGAWSPGNWVERL